MTGSSTTDAGGVKVTWGKVGGAAKYRVFCKVGTGSWKVVGDTTGTSLTVKTSDGKTVLKSGTKYTFTVRCINSTGTAYTSGYDTTEKSITYVATNVGLSTPQITSLTNENGGVAVKWNVVAGAAKYRVFCKVGTGSWQGVGDTTGTSLTVKTSDGKTALKSGTKYTFTVRCINSTGTAYASGYNTTGKSILYR